MGIVRTEPTCNCGHPKFDHTGFSKPSEFVWIECSDFSNFSDPKYGECANGAAELDGIYRVGGCTCKKFVATSGRLAQFFRKVVGICTQVL